MELQHILSIFKYLATPFETPSPRSSSLPKVINNSPEDVLQNITKYCLENVDFLESSKTLLSENAADESLQESSNSSWNLTCIILSLLSKLKATIEEVEASQTEEEKAIDVLSIQSQINVQKSVELVIGFGIIPYLLPGIGVPDKLRKMSASVPYFFVDAKTASPYVQYLRLSHTIEILLNCCDHPSLNALILSHYTTDMLAGLLQICKAPITPPKIQKSATSKENNGSLTNEEYENVMKIRKILLQQFRSTFLTKAPVSSYINSLFVIGAVERPRWLRNACSDLLHEAILSKNGLIVVSTVLLESSGRSDMWKLMRVISNLMKAALEKSGKLNDHETLRSLSEQCFHLVNQNQEEETTGKIVVIQEKNLKNDVELSKDGYINCPLTSFNLPYGTNVELLRIGLFCSFALMEADSAIVKLAFWDRLFFHVLQLDRSQEIRKNVDCGIKLREESMSKSTCVSATIQKTALCVTYGELLLSLLKPMNVTFPVKILQPVWSLYFQIFVACEGYLKKPVQEPKLSGAIEQLHHKLKDVLILLFEIYASGSGQSLSLPSINVKSDASVDQARSEEKESIDLCDFCMTLIINHEAHQDAATINKFDFVEKNDEDMRIIRFHREMISSSSNYNNVFDEYLNPSCVTLANSILKNEKLKAYWPTVFRQLLSWGTKKHERGKIYKSFKSDEMPTHLSGNSNSDECAIVNLTDCKRFLTFKILGELGEEEAILEQFGMSESTEDTFSFLDLLLNKFTTEAFLDVDDSFDSGQLIMYALGIIGALVEAASAATATMSIQPPVNQSPSFAMIDKELNNMWDSLESFIPHLRKLTECTHPNLVRQGIPNMASNLLLSIGTRGVAGLKSKANSKEIFKSRYQQAVEDAMNPMVHVKGHGILELRRLIEERDRDTLENEVEVIKIFHENLSNEDSYVYLLSIQGMAALALRLHRKVVPVLIKEYDFASCENVGGEGESDKPDFSTSQVQMYLKLDSEERIEIRLKLGEILVKVIRNLGGLAPSYRVPLTNVFFRLVRDEEPLIRASALSNLGELCHLLKFSLGVILTEVWYCVESILSTEKNIHVRRAALHLIVLLLKGVEKEFTAQDILGDSTISEHLRDVRRFLTQMERTEIDLVAKTQCQLALKELELIVRKLLTPNTSLEFKIQVLNF